MYTLRSTYPSMARWYQPTMRNYMIGKISPRCGSIYPPWQKPFRGTLLNAEHPLARNLVFCLLLNEGSAEPFDLVARGQASFGANPAWIPTPYGHGLYFERDDSDYMTIADTDLAVGFPGKSGESAMDFSCFAIVKILSLNEHNRILCKEHQDQRSWYWAVINTGAHYLQIYRDASNGYDSGFTTLNTGQWYSLGFTHEVTGAETSTVREYVDGTYRSQDTNFVSGPFVNTNTLDIGRYDWGTDNFADMELALACVWNRKLADEEIAWLHREPYCMFTQSRRIYITDRTLRSGRIIRGYPG